MDNNNTVSAEENYKEILSYVKDFFRTRKFIFLCLFIALILGIISVLVTPKTYTSKVTFIVQGSSKAKSSGGISSIVNLLSGGGSSASSGPIDIPTFLYPRILESLSFQRQLYETPINLKGLDSTVTYKKYALELEQPSFGSKLSKYTIGLPGLLFNSDSKPKNIAVHQIDSLIYVSNTERKIFRSLNDKISFDLAEEDGTIEISTTFTNEPIAAAQLTESVRTILQKEIISYRIAKAQEKYEFINKQYQEKKKLFSQSQASLASYNDRNLFNQTNSSLIRKQRLQDESLLLYTIFSDLEQQRLAQSIKIQEDTPTFTVINPAVVPSSADAKSSLKTIVLFLFVGFLIAVFRYLFIVTRRYLKYLWKEID